MAVPTHNVEKTFGLIIAFIFPGLIGLFALSLHFEVLRGWLGIVGSESATGPTAGGLVLVLLLAAGLGTIISGVRSELIDKRWRPSGPPAAGWKARRAEAEELVYQNLLIQFYRYAQLHGNVVVAATGFFVSWLLQRQVFALDVAVAGASAAWFLVSWLCWRTGRDMLKRYDERRKALLNEGDQPNGTNVPTSHALPDSTSPAPVASLAPAERETQSLSTEPTIAPVS